MKGGSIEFLTKPFRDQDLLDAIQLGFERDRSRRENETALTDVRARFETPGLREREVMVQVVRGHPSKQIATALGISKSTVKVHRSSSLRQMKARSIS
jgi:FixJ family two-component response regulator